MTRNYSPISVLFLNTKSVRAILKEMLHCGTPGSREETNGSG